MKWLTDNSLSYQAIAINNDFINQRENCMNISLDLMQKQINDLGAKIIHEVERLEAENSLLQESLRKHIKEKENKGPKLYENENSLNAKRIPSSSKNFNYQSAKDSMDLCQQELINTKKNCNKVKYSFLLKNLFNWILALWNA